MRTVGGYQHRVCRRCGVAARMHRYGWFHAAGDGDLDAQSLDNDHPVVPILAHLYKP